MRAAPLTPSEIARRHQLAAARLNGAIHQDERPAEPIETEPAFGPLFSETSPPVDVWLVDEAGLRRWRPVIDRIDVVPLPNGERLLVVGQTRVKLPEAAAKHLGKLLS